MSFAQRGKNGQPHLIWIYPQTLSEALDSATWLETTRELRRMGWRVTLIAVGTSGQQVLSDIEITCLTKPTQYLVGQIIFHLRCLNLIRRLWQATDIILFHQISAPWVLTLRLVPVLRGCQRPWLVMDTRTLFMVPGDRQALKDRVRRQFYLAAHWLANHFADGQLAISQGMAQAVHIPPARLWGIWPSGVDANRFASACSLRQWSRRPDPIRLIYVGVLHYERNLMALCQAVLLANAESRAFSLTLVGDGTERRDLERLASQSDGAIRVTSRVPHEQIPAVLAQADVGVMPFPDELKFRVSSPIKLFEFLAAGLPLLVTEIPFLHEILDGQNCAFWARSGEPEALLEALQHVVVARDALPEMGARAETAAQAWTWEQAAVKLSDSLTRAQNQRVAPLELARHSQK